MNYVVDKKDKEIEYNIRSYNHQVLDLTIFKSDTLLSILLEYRRLASIMLNKQFTNIYKTGIISTQSKDFYGGLKSFLSERYKDVIKRQVDGMVKSYISNRQNDFKSIVYKSNLDKEVKKDLYKINKRKEWFNKENLLARKIFKHILSKNKRPSTKSINMCLNTKVYDLEINKTTTSCDYHIRLRTCNNETKNIILPLKSNSYFNKFRVKGFINNSINLTFDKSNILKNIVLSLSLPKETNYVGKTDVIGLDFGLTNLLTTNLGDTYSKNFIKKLKYYDNKSIKLVNELKKRDKNYKLSNNKRYVRLRSKIKGFIKNETNRVVNRVVEVYKPKKIVLEDLNFKNTNLSKGLNRLISNCGLGVLNTKMNILSDYITIEYVNPAYTSQECNKCNYVDKENRKTQKVFKCLCCGLSINADINGSRVIISRANDNYFISNKYLTYKEIIKHLNDKNKRYKEKSTP